MRSAAAAVLLVFSIGICAQERDLTRYDRLLIPMETRYTPGANNSVWATRLFIRNDGETPLDLFPLSPPSCPVSSGCRQIMRGYPALARFETAIDYNQGPEVSHTCGRASGCFLYVERDKIDQLSIQLHVVDGNSGATDLTRLPVVWASEFFSTRRSITSIPSFTGARLGLRIYTLDPSRPEEFVVRIYDASWRRSIEHPGFFEPARLLATAQITTSVVEQSCGFWWNCPTGITYNPGFVILQGIEKLVPELETRKPFGIRIEVEPVTPGTRYWPMATLTDNATNRTQVYTVR